MAYCNFFPVEDGYRIFTKRCAFRAKRTGGGFCWEILRRVHADGSSWVAVETARLSPAEEQALAKARALVERIEAKKSELGDPFLFHLWLEGLMHGEGDR